MNKLLAKVCRPTSTATGRDPERRTDAPGIRKARKPGQRRMLAILMMPALVTVLALLSTGVANANALPTGGNGPTISVGGGLKVTTNWQASVTCDAAQHTISISATAVPAQSYEPVYEQVYLYSYKTGAGRWGTVNNTVAFNGKATYQPGYYAVAVIFGWWTTAGWLTAGPYYINSYTQLGIQTPTWDNAMSSCYV